MTPKNPGIAQKGTQKSGSNPKKVPKILAHPRITIYAGYPPDVHAPWMSDQIFPVWIEISVNKSFIVYLLKNQYRIHIKS